MADADRCVCCGAIVPKGRMVCRFFAIVTASVLTDKSGK